MLQPGMQHSYQSSVDRSMQSIFADPVIELDSLGTVRPWPCELALRELRTDRNHGVELFVEATGKHSFIHIPNTLMDGLIHGLIECPNIDSLFKLPVDGSWSTWNAAIDISGFSLHRYTITGVKTSEKTPRVFFQELVTILRTDSRITYQPKDGAVCAWYGGALLYAEPNGMKKLIDSVCAARPDIAATQIAFDMAVQIDKGTETLIDNVLPRRNRMRV